MKKTYYATVDGHINGALRKKGDDVGAMTEREAKYAEMSGIISTAKPGEPGTALTTREPDPTTLDRKTR